MLFTSIHWKREFCNLSLVFSSCSFLLKVRVILENCTCRLMHMSVTGDRELSGCHIIIRVQRCFVVFVCSLLVNTHLRCPSASPTYWEGLGWLWLFLYERHANTHVWTLQSYLHFYNVCFHFQIRYKGMPGQIWKWDTRGRGIYGEWGCLVWLF